MNQKDFQNAKIGDLFIGPDSIYYVLSEPIMYDNAATCQCLILSDKDARKIERYTWYTSQYSDWTIQKCDH
jgi:hypothetical protein